MNVRRETFAWTKKFFSIYFNISVCRYIIEILHKNEAYSKSLEEIRGNKPVIKHQSYSKNGTNHRRSKKCHSPERHPDKSVEHKQRIENKILFKDFSRLSRKWKIRVCHNFEYSSNEQLFIYVNSIHANILENWFRQFNIFTTLTKELSVSIKKIQRYLYREEYDELCPWYF